MKKLLIIFFALLVCFIAVWTYKIGTPLSPSNPFEDGLSEDTPWWETIAAGETPQADDDWKLDPEIPDNYIPVLGEDELYIVINEDGTIQEYRKRIQQEDGSWVWETVNPDIPENYEPVEGLENVYRVTEEDGSVHYYKYHRNSDDTYYFIEVDKNGNEIETNIAPVDDKGIPKNYIRIDGTNIYAVYNEYGVLIGYKERVQLENGTYSWRDCDAPTSSGQNSLDWNSGNISTGTGAILGTTVVGDSGKDGNITIINGDTGEEKGYSETKTTTEIKEEDGYFVVYETTITYEYDLQGSLSKTQKSDSEEINRLPITEENRKILYNAYGLG